MFFHQTMLCDLIDSISIHHRFNVDPIMILYWFPAILRHCPLQCVEVPSESQEEKPVRSAHRLTGGGQRRPRWLRWCTSVNRENQKSLEHGLGYRLPKLVSTKVRTIGLVIGGVMTQAIGLRIGRGLRIRFEIGRQTCYFLRLLRSQSPASSSAAEAAPIVSQVQPQTAAAVVASPPGIETVLIRLPTRVSLPPNK